MSEISFPAGIMALDTETALIGPGVLAPPLVCVSWVYVPAGVPVSLPALRATCEALRAAQSPEDMDAIQAPPGILWGLSGPDEGLELVASALADVDMIVGHNLAYDVSVVCEESADLFPAFVRAYESDRVACTMIRDQLLDVAHGQFRSHEDVDDESGEVSFRKVGYSLAELTDRILGIRLDKSEDGWRMRYSSLAGQPPAEWPVAARSYACLDAWATLAAYVGQTLRWIETARAMADGDESDFVRRVVGGIPTEGLNTRAHWALHRTGGRGLCVDAGPVAELQARLRTTVVELRAKLQESGIYRADGTKDMARMRELVTEAYGGDPPTTEKGAVQTSRAIMAEANSPVLQIMAELGKTEKLLSGFVPHLAAGLAAPVVARYQPLVESMRTSCQSPNVQNLPRVPGVRECFVPRPGFVFASVDFGSEELRTLGQACLDLVGESKLAALYQANPEADPHLAFAAIQLGISESEARARKGEPAVAKARQDAKPANFGFPGGLGIQKFREFAKATYGAVYDDSEATDLKEAFHAAWPEVRPYQAWCAAQVDEDNRATVETIRTGYVRTWAGRSHGTYTSLCNHHFQHLAAAAAKRALWVASVYGPDRGVFPVAFLHDEIVAEIPEDQGHEGAQWLAQIMVEAHRQVCPDVPGTAEPALMRRWYKSAKPRHNSEGTLIPWAP